MQAILNTPDIKSSRITQLDVAKGIAIIAVILGHSGLKSINAVVYSFHLPLFFLVSGYFCNTDAAFIDFIRKRFKQLIIPYVIASCIIITLLTVEALASGTITPKAVFKSYVLAALYGSGGRVQLPWGNINTIGAIWFLPATFFAQVIWRYVVTKQKPFLWLIIIAVVGYYTSKLIWLPMSIQAGMTCAIFIYLGHYGKGKIELNSRKDTKSTIFYVLCAIVWLINILFFPHFYIVDNHMQGGFLNIAGGVCGSLLVIRFSFLLSSFFASISSFFKWCGTHSLIILCIHDIDMLCGYAYEICSILGIGQHNEVVAIRLLTGALLATAAYALARKIIKRYAPFSRVSLNN